MVSNIKVAAEIGGILEISSIITLLIAGFKSSVNINFPFDKFTRLDTL